MRRTLLVAALAAAYVVLVFGWRWWRDSGPVAPPPRPALHPAYQGNELKVLNFLATPAAIQRGGKALLCYGVLNAESVRVVPLAEELKPSLSRCVEIRPRATTEYRLEAKGKGGAKAEARVVVEVR